jgi:RHS repeat-associated protein
LQKLTYANGATEEYFYNADKTLNKVKNTHGTTVEEHTYTYDNNKNITQEVTPTKTVVNTYDALNRLKTVTKNGVVTTYAYDQSGNRSQEVTGSITKDYVYDSKNKLSQITENDNGAVTKVTTYEYDLNGNLLTTKENDIIVETNVFNDRNELTSTTKNNITTTYSYNVEGKRISKSDGTDTTKFVYDGTKIILEVDGNNNELSKNVYGLALVSRTSGSNSGYYLYNGHGDVVLIVDALNQALNTYEYDAFGNITNETETLDNPYKYSGYYYDSETGNYYLMSRYYDPAIARFISEDTYRGELTDPLSLNRYVYVNNNPLIYDDPTGHFLEGLLEEFKKGGMKIGAAFQATGELAVDAAVGLGELAWTTGELAGSTIGLSGNEIAHQLGITNEDTYNYLHDSYLATFSKSSKIITSLPKDVMNGIKKNIQTTFNIDNFMNYSNTDNYNEMVSYSKSAIQTGLTIYGGAKILQSAGNMVGQIGASISFNPMPTLVTPEGFTFSSIGSFSMDIASINQAIINGAQSIGVNASMIAGANGGGNFDKKPSLKNLSKKELDRILEKNGYDDIHGFKREYVDDISKFNVKIDTNTGELYLEGIKNKAQIPTNIYK